MITLHDLDSAIAECQGKRNPDSSTCIKLAAFYTIKREMFGEEKEAEPIPSYSYAPPPDNIVNVGSDSEFARAVDGRSQEDVWPVIDELMDTLQVIMPRLYDATMSQLH